MSKTWLIIFIACFYCSTSLQAREVTNEDIRNALLSLAHTVQAGEGKLERHELRERHLGEFLKKSLTSIEKRQRNLEPIKGTLSRLDERLANVETILIQKDERERIQLQKTTNAIEDIRNTLQAWMTTMETVIRDLAVPPKDEPPINNNDSISKEDLIKIQKTLSNQVDSVLTKVDNLQNEVIKVQEDNKQIKQLNEKSVSNLNLVDGKLKNSEKLLEKYENHLAELNNRVTPPQVPQPIVKEQPDWHPNFLTALEQQRTHLDKILSDIKSVETKLGNLPESSEISTNQNATLDVLQELRYEIGAKSEKSTVKLDTRLKDLEDKLSKNQDELMKGVHDIGEMSETVYGDVAKSYEQLRGEVQALSKVERVMIQTADNVLDTKRRIEYGVHQILLEVGDLVKINSKELNSTLNQRFDNIELTILDNQTGALANLSSKLEQEMSQVWRQIGIMYQELTASTTALDRLQEQTETYVNGSLFTMDSMEDKVGKITSRMAEVDGNLNYLLGRLSLVTQEFNQIKVGLGTALDNIRSSFQTVQDKLKDAGPGPHQIVYDPQAEK